MKKKAGAAKLDQSHAPSFFPLRPTSPPVHYPPLRIIPYEDLMQQFHAARPAATGNKQKQY